MTESAQQFIDTGIGICLLLFIALAVPNTLQILARYEPALGIRPAATRLVVGRIRLVEWCPSLAWAVAMSAMATIALVHIGGPSEFLYWQF